MLQALVAAAAVATAARAQAPIDPCDGLHVRLTDNAIVDSCGRARIFRGLNVIYKGAPWHPVTTPGPDGFDPFASMNDVDAALWQSLGLNVVRLGVMWPGVVPSPAAANATYLALMTNLTATLGSHGIYSLLDFHQDSLGDVFCGEGIPDWAATRYAAGSQAFPLPVDQPYAINSSTGEPSPADCNRHDWTDYYFADALCVAAQVRRRVGPPYCALACAHLHSAHAPLPPLQALYNNSGGSWGDFAFFWGAVARAWAGHDYVLGYELMNEPWAGNVLADPALLVPGVADRANLQPIFLNTTVAIRAAEASAGGRPRMVFTEGVTWDDIFPLGFDTLPGASDGLGSISYHYYDLPNFDADAQIGSRLADAARLGAGALLTEFDFGPDDPSPISDTIDTADSYAQGYIGWEHKIYVGITGANYGLYNGTDGSLVPAKAQVISRPFPMAVGGFITSYAFDSTTASFTLTYSQDGNATAPTQVYIPTQLWYNNLYNVTVLATPENTVSWVVEPHSYDGRFGPAGSINAAGWPVPTPVSYAYLWLTPVATTPGYDGAQVTVLITAAG